MSYSTKHRLWRVFNKQANKAPMTSHPSPLDNSPRVLPLNSGPFLTRYVIPALLILLVSTVVLIRAWLTFRVDTDPSHKQLFCSRTHQWFPSAPFKHGAGFSKC